MKRSLWPWLLAASLLVNVGVIAAAWLPEWRAGAPVERMLFGMGHEEVASHLRLDAEQRRQWHAMEADFLESLQRSGGEIEQHRARLVHSILGVTAEAEAIERERAAIFALQEKQQRAVIAQLLREREMLRPGQREALAELLLARGAGIADGHGAGQR